MKRNRSSNITSENTTQRESSNVNNLIYNLPEGLNCRSMCSVTADDQNHRFVVGTCNVNRPNELHVINYAEETNRILLEQVLTYEHGEVFDLKASPYNMDIMACSSRAATDG